ncbi:ADP-ribosyl cyclase/cyclic ADP-ribose hydrolase [Nematostella vectensis]|uniref:ADP-ribosyl cyclase/cyclic ADP-ribose hydrolase n=1 Tax=Nematostella vectensis TaxID=45351 RepID=UPI00138FBA96|nr:ADP-ribosyl cyclase/cyclic ADP-ribose hydrolase [Nematostella vectensis]XP_048582149.1 ADP-ribosyl cyclase/cyclic ADP-ribose hydrolase [Nematostella vectensis]
MKEGRHPVFSSSSFAIVLWVSLSHLLCLVPAGPIDFSKPLEGTTPDIKNIFLTRCNNYLQTKKGNGLYNTDADKNPDKFCQETWTIFSNAFIRKDICTVKIEDYMPYFKKTGQTPIRDKLMFWSGTFKLSGKYAKDGQVAITLAETLTGALVTELNWCGDKTSPDGINYKQCTRCKKNENDETLEGFEVFWSQASAEFARRAVGKVRHLITSTGTKLESPRREKSYPAFHKYTFFYKYELPNLNTDEMGNPVRKVTGLEVILVNDPTFNTPLPDEHCGKGSLKQLEAEVAEKGRKAKIPIPFTCVENPKEIMDILKSSDQPISSEKRSKFKRTRQGKHWKVV